MTAIHSYPKDAKRESQSLHWQSLRTGCPLVSVQSA